MARRFFQACWPFLAAALFFAGVLAYGMSVGEMAFPAKGHMIRFARADEPFGFWFGAAFYAGMVGLACWVPLLCLTDPQIRHGADAPPKPRGS